MIHRGVNNCAVHYAPLNAMKKKKYAAPSPEENENIKMFDEYIRRRTGCSATKV